MYCRNCKSELQDGMPYCLGCGVPVGKGKNYCPHCGGETAPEAVICVKCGASLQEGKQEPVKGGRSAMVAGLLGIFLGTFGVHNFYLKRTGRALVQLSSFIFLIFSYVFFALAFISLIPPLMIVSVFVLILAWIGVVAASVWALVESILLLCGKVKTDGKKRPLAP